MYLDRIRFPSSTITKLCLEFSPGGFPPTLKQAIKTRFDPFQSLVIVTELDYVKIICANSDFDPGWTETKYPSTLARIMWVTPMCCNSIFTHQVAKSLASREFCH